jgi:4-aminobutyrate aminotransferase
LAVAAAHAVLDIMFEENLPERANVLGHRLKLKLEQAKTKNRRMGDIRALGAMVACEIVNPDTGAPDADQTKQVQQAALKKGLLLLTCGVYGNVIRFLFPLTIEDNVFDEAMTVLDSVLA